MGSCFRLFPLAAAAVCMRNKFLYLCAPRVEEEEEEAAAEWKMVVCLMDRQIRL